jgi:hypothetical protein
VSIRQIFLALTSVRVSEIIGSTYGSKTMGMAPSTKSPALFPRIISFQLNELVKNADRKVKILIAEILSQRFVHKLEAVGIVVVSRYLAAEQDKDISTL